jgi:hypothetical protein
MLGMECEYDQRRANTAAIGANADELPAHVLKGYCEKEHESGFEFILP